MVCLKKKLFFSDMRCGILEYDLYVGEGDEAAINRDLAADTRTIL